MTEPIPAAGPEPSDEPFHVQWLRSHANRAPSKRPGGRRRRVVAASLACGVIGVAGVMTLRNRSTTASAGQPATATRAPLHASFASAPLATAGAALDAAAVRAPSSDPPSALAFSTAGAPTTTLVSTTAAPTSTAASTTEPPTTPAPATTAAPAPAPPAYEFIEGPPSDTLPGGQLWPQGFYEDSKLHLQGTLPSREIADAVVAKSAAIIGADNVVDEFDIDPTVPLVRTALVRLGPTVLFEPESDVIRSQYGIDFELMAAFLSANPDVTLTIIGYADGQGEPGYNLRLAQRRADAARARLLADGIDPARVDTVGRGNQDAVGNNATSGGRALNRRIEFAVTGIFG